jgi:signal-transduction protein with cAMP-binding, CBS, and nucleotidyltransferase domain
MLNKITASLQQAAIFQSLQAAQLSELARHAERVKFAAGEIITQAGAAGNGAYLLVSGAAERQPEPSEHGKPEQIPPGSLIGQLAMLIEHRYGSTVVARDRVFCLKITREGMHAQMLSDPALTEHIQHHITSRLVAVAEQLREIDVRLMRSAGAARAATPRMPARLALQRPTLPSPAA